MMRRGAKVRRWGRWVKRAGSGCLVLVVLVGIWRLPMIVVGAPSFVTAPPTLAPWMSAMVPIPSGLGNQVTINALSCPSVGNCVAVGNSLAAGGNGNAAEATELSAPLVETLSGGAWTKTVPVVPSCGIPLANGACRTVEISGSTVTDSVHSAALTGISCTSSTSCVAIGDEVPLFSPDGDDQYGASRPTPEQRQARLPRGPRGD